jgi:hypothetical protein
MLMMVLFDFLSKCIAPVQLCTRPAWLYTEVNDTKRLEHSRGLDLNPKVLDTMLGLDLPQLHHSTNGLHAHLLGPVDVNEATEGATHNGRY